MEMPSHQVPVTNRPSKIANLQFPVGASWSILARTEFQVTRAIGNALLADVRPGNSAVGGHDVYDNAGTSMKFRSFVRICMLLIENRLLKSGGCSVEKRGIKK
jgi:hypothetical protein